MCKENMALYEQFRSCPKEAQKPIVAGRLKGKTDINPMWRIKRLTEVFGPCGFGWKINILRMWLESGCDSGEMTANVHIALRVKHNGEWSESIEGVGGAMFLESERNGMHMDDDCYKKAYTDAISVACKQLGIAADIYWDADPETKYQTAQTTQNSAAQPATSQPPLVCADCGKPIDSNMAARTHKAFGATLCADCGMIRHKLIEAQKSNQ